MNFFKSRKSSGAAERAEAYLQMSEDYREFEVKVPRFIAQTVHRVVEGFDKEFPPELSEDETLLAVKLRQALSNSVSDEDVSLGLNREDILELFRIPVAASVLIGFSEKYGLYEEPFTNAREYFGLAFMQAGGTLPKIANLGNEGAAG